MSGWTNTGVTTLTIPTGATSGARVVIANPATGDAIDIYDSSNRLVFSIDGAGELATTVYPSQDSALLEGIVLSFFNQASFPDTPAAVSGTSSAVGSSLSLDSGTGHLATDSTLSLRDSLDSSDGHAYIQAHQKGGGGGTSLGGSLVQTDTTSSKNNAIHLASYSITTDASGNATFNHGAAFSPQGGFMSCDSVAGVDFFQYVWLDPPFNSTTASVHFADHIGNPVANKTVFAYGFFFG